MALLRSLAEGLLEKGSMKTTEAKAKEVSSFVEKLITKGKTDTLANRRLVSSRLGTPARGATLMKVAANYKERAGGYTRVTKLPPRPADGSPMAIIELVK